MSDELEDDIEEIEVTLISAYGSDKRNLIKSDDYKRWQRLIARARLGAAVEAMPQLATLSRRGSDWNFECDEEISGAWRCAESALDAITGGGTARGNET